MPFAVGGMGMNREVFHIGLRETDGARVLRLSGELDSFTKDRLTAISDTWIRGVKRLVVNLDELQYIDSAGLSTLVWMWAEAKKNGTQMVISCANPRIYRIFEITGLLNLFTLEPPASNPLMASTPIYGPPVFGSTITSQGGEREYLSPLDSRARPFKETSPFSSLEDLVSDADNGDQFGNRPSSERE